MNLNPLNSFSWSCRMSRHLAAPDLWAHTAGCRGYLRHLQEESHKHSVWASETITRKKSKRDPKQVCNNFQHSWATLRIDKSCLLIFRKKREIIYPRKNKTKQNRIWTLFTPISYLSSTPDIDNDLRKAAFGESYAGPISKETRVS